MFQEEQRKKKDILCCHSTDNLQTIHIHTYFCINKRKQQSRGDKRYLNKSELPHIEDISLEALVPSCKQHARNQQTTKGIIYYYYANT